jgi:hypothetical protein
LKKKHEYYVKNKEAILEKKHARQDIIYQNKVARNMESDKEFEKEYARKLSKLETIRPEACELCNTHSSKLDHLLEFHHFDYQKVDEGSWLCKPCHAEADKMRRRQDGST